MSMPKIEKQANPVDREQSVNNLIESVALMETGLSHIVNAEGEKIQKVINAQEEPAIDDMLKINNSVETMVNSISKLEMILQNKLDTSKDLDGNDNNNNNYGTIIPYTGYVDLSTTADGRPNVGGSISFAYTSAYVAIPLNANLENVDVPYNITAFSSPRDGILTSISAYFYLIDSHSAAPDTQVIGRLYMAEPNTTIFKPIDGAIVNLTPKVNPDMNNDELTGFIDNLNVKIPARNKVVLLFYITANGMSVLYGLCGAGINIK